MTLRIGMFDSGVGGLTVLSEVKHLLPHNSFFYFGDTARCPYGGKSKSTITRYSLENSAFLHTLGIDLLIIACHTASALAIDAVQQQLSIPILGVIEPAITCALQATRTGHIGVIGTKATIASQVYEQKLKAAHPGITVTSLACPLFVPLVEEQFPNTEIIRLVVQEYLQPLKNKKIDTLLLGCTHYPLLRPYIAEEMGPEVSIINPATTCAQAAHTLCQQLTPHSNEPLEDRFFVSDDPERFRHIGEHFLGYQVIPLIPSIPCTNFPDGKLHMV